MTKAIESTPVSRTDHQGTLRFNKLEDLHNAVLVFGGEGDQSAKRHNIDALDQAKGSMAGVMFAMASRNSGSFTQRVVKEIGNLDRPYRGSWDWDGPGPFHKASIDAKREKDGTFTLDINASYVDNKPEITLAKQVGAPIGYYNCKIEKEYAASKDGRFSIPLSEVVSIYKAVGVSINEADAFAALTTKTTPKEKWDRPELPQAVLCGDEDVKVTMGFVGYTTVSPYDEEKNPGRDYGYRLGISFPAGSALRIDVLTGPAIKRPDGTYAPVRLGVGIWPSKNPTFDPAVEQRIRQIGDVIEATWNGNNGPTATPTIKPDGITPV